VRRESVAAEDEVTIKCHQQDQARRGVTTQRRRAKREAGCRRPILGAEASSTLCAQISNLRDNEPAHHPEGAVGTSPSIINAGIDAGARRLSPPAKKTCPGLGQYGTPDKFPAQWGDEPRADSLCPIAGEYLTTGEAAKYLRMSVSRLLRLQNLEYLRGRPNIYSKQDLDNWFERNKSGHGMKR
jgi:hypothetical protein